MEPASFNLKPRDELERIVHDISQSLELTDMHIELASDHRMDALVEFLAKDSFPDEILTKSLDIKVDDIMAGLIKLRLAQNMSLLLISDITDEVIGCRTISLERQESDNDPSAYKDLDENVQIAIRFVKHMDSEMDVYKNYNVEYFAQFGNLGVRRDFRRQGLATKLMEAALQFLKQIGLESLCIKGEGTVNSSQRIYERFNFKLLHTLKYEEYLENGKVVITNTGDNKCCKIYVKQL